MFTRLLDVAPVKAFFHLLVMALLSACLVAACRLVPIYAMSAKVCEELVSCFGSVEVSKDGFVPKLNSGARKGFIASSSFRLDYFPPGGLSLKDMDEWKESSGMFWMQTGLMFWVAARSEGKITKYMLLPFQLLTSSVAKAPTGYQPKEVLEDYLLKDVCPPAVAAPPLSRGPSALKPVELQFKTLGILSVLIAAGTIFCGTFAGVLFVSVIAIVFFASAQYIWIAQPSPRLKFKNILVIMAYASFPPLAIATLFPALDLPLLGFQTVFFVCFFVYHLLAFNRVQRHLNPPPKGGSQSSWDDEEDDTF